MIVRKRQYIAETGTAHTMTIETANKPGDYTAMQDGGRVASMRAVKREGRTGYDVRTVGGFEFSRFDGIDGALAALVSIGRVGGLQVKPC